MNGLTQVGPRLAPAIDGLISDPKVGTLPPDTMGIRILIGTTDDLPVNA